MPTIFDLVTSNEIVSYWELNPQNEPPFLGEELFPSEQKLGLDLKWLKGASGLPVVLKPSAFDVAAIPRPRIGFDSFSAQMPFFKESKYIDEELRQELNKVLETNNQAYIDAILTRIFADNIDLLRGARAQRERMRMMALTSGIILIEGNGQVYEYDYGMPSDHKITAKKDWSDPTADIIGDIKGGMDKILEDTGATVERAVTTSKVLGYMRANTAIKQTLNDATTQDRYISDNKLIQFLNDEFGIEVVVNDKKYKDEEGKTQRYIPDNTFTMFPAGKLGTTWFGTTPEQSDLMASAVANVTITDVGVAVTTSEKVDPVQVDTKVSQIVLPDFPTADQVFIIDTKVA